ncbi:MAG: glycosyltransferase family 39 protein [Planctomycetota bacterium]
MTRKNTGVSFTLTIASIIREGGLPLFLLLFSALILKIVYQLDFDANNPLARYPVSDELLYISDAAEIASGTLERTEVFHSAPLYPYLLAPLFAVCGEDAMASRIFQALLGTGSVLLFYLTARFFFTRPWALLAALVMVLYYPFSFFESKLLIITSAVFFMNLSLLLFIGQIQVPRIYLAACAGIAVGITTALRPNLILMIPLFIIWFIWVFRGRSWWIRGLLFLAGVALPIIPFTIHNYKAADDFVLLSDNGGINFYFGNNPSSRGSFFIEDPTWGHIEQQFYMAKTIAEEAQSHALKPSEISDYWFKQGLTFIREQPGAYLYLLFQKLKSFLENFEYAIIYSPSVERHLTRSLYIPFLPYAVIVAGAFLGLAALGLMLGKRKEIGDPKGGVTGFDSEKWLPVFIILFINLLTVLLFFNYSRFRLIVVPSMILIGIFGCSYTLDCFRAGRWRGFTTLAAATAAGLVVSLVISPWEEPMKELWRLQKSHGFATIAEAYSRAGKYENADRYYTQAMELLPDNSITVSKRGMLRIEAGNLEGAKADLEEALRLSPDYALHYAALAEFYGRDSSFRDLDKALELIQEALLHPIQTPQIMSNIRLVEGNIRMSRGEPQLAVGAYEDAYNSSPYMTEALFLTGLALKESGDRENAALWFQRCIDADPNNMQARFELQQMAGSRRLR